MSEAKANTLPASGLPPVPEAARPRPLTAGVLIYRFVAAATMFGAHFFATFILLQIYAAMGARYLPIVRAFDVDLPLGTERLLFACGVVNRTWYLFFFPFTAGDGILALLFQFRLRNYRWCKYIWFNGYLVLVLALLMYATLGFTWAVSAYSDHLHAGP